MRGLPRARRGSLVAASRPPAYVNATIPNGTTSAEVAADTIYVAAGNVGGFQRTMGALTLAPWTAPRYDGPMDPHRIAEARSLALHRLIAERLLVDPRIVEQARALAMRWLAEGRASHYMQHWLELLSRDARELAATIIRDDEDLRALRQCTPFAGIISPRERWALWRTVRERCEAAQ